MTDVRERWHHPSPGALSAADDEANEFAAMTMDQAQSLRITQTFRNKDGTQNILHEKGAFRTGSWDLSSHKAIQENPPPKLIKSLTQEVERWFEPRQHWRALSVSFGIINPFVLDLMSQQGKITPDDYQKPEFATLIFTLRSPNPPMHGSSVDLARVFSSRLRGDLRMEGNRAHVYPRSLRTFNPIEHPQVPVNERLHFTVVYARPTFDRATLHDPKQFTRKIPKHRDILVWVTLQDIYQYVVYQQRLLAEMQKQIEEQFGIKQPIHEGLPNW